MTLRRLLIVSVMLAVLVPLSAWAEQTQDPNDPWYEADPDTAGNGLLELLYNMGLVPADLYGGMMDTHSRQIYFGIRPTGSILVDYTPWNQMKYDEVMAYPGSPQDERGFRIRKAEFGFAGRAFYNWLSFKVTGYGAPDSTGRYALGLEEAWARVAWTPMALRGSAYQPTIGGTIGAMKIPFSRQNQTSTYALQLINRAMVIDQMPIQYDIGATFDAGFNYDFDMVNLTLRGGAFNGRGNRVYATDNNDNLMYTGRVQLDLLNPMRPGEGDLQPEFYPNRYLARYPETNGPQLSLGGSYLQNNDLSQVVKAWGADAEFRFYGFSLLGEVISTRYEPILSENMSADQFVDNWETFGWYVQGGYYIKWVGLELVGRYEEYKMDLLTDVMPKRRLAATTVGLNWHIASRHRAKLMLDYTRRTELEGMPEIDNDSVTAQFGLAF